MVGGVPADEQFVIERCFQLDVAGKPRRLEIMAIADRALDAAFCGTAPLDGMCQFVRQELFARHCYLAKIALRQTRYFYRDV